MTLRHAHAEPEAETNPTEPRMVPAAPLRPADDETVIDLRHLAAALWRGKWILLAFALIGFGLGVKRLHEHTPTYKARMVVSPSLSTDATSIGGGGGASGAQLGALAGLAGLTIGSQQMATTFDRLKEVFKSFELAQTMDEKYGLFMRIFGGGWDAKTESWIRPQGWRFELDQDIAEFLSQPTWQPPNMESLARYLGGAIQVNEIKGAPFMEIAVQHPDPEFALNLLKVVYAEADQLLREQDRREVNQRRSYLEERLARTSLSDMRQVVLMLMAQEERSAMLLESELPYAARTIEPAYVSSQPVSLRPTIEIGIRVIGWLAFGVALVAGWAVLRGRA